MMDIKDKKQIKAIEWINDLKHYAKEQKLPMRIMDELENCKMQLSSEEVDWENIDTEVMELLKSIEEKTNSLMVKDKNSKQQVSVKQVEIQVKKMAQRCHAENITSVDSMAERKNILIKKNCVQIKEITHAKAHLEELKNENLYLQFFQTCKTSYERDAMEMFSDMLQSISSNYDHMVNHMKSMFQNIGGYKNGIGNEKFYYEYEERRTGIDKKIQSEVETSDIGGNDIISFGQKTKDTIKKIIKKQIKKRKIFAWIPLIILLCTFIFGSVMTQEQNKDTIERVETTKENDDSPVKELAKKAGMKIIEKGSMGTVLSSCATLLLTLVISLGAVLIFVLLLIILIYIFYLKIMKILCNHTICKECGEYLTTELIQFEQNNELSVKLETAMKNAAEEYEKQYMDILHYLFTGTQYDSDNTTQDDSLKISSLREEWNKIKYE